MEGDGELGGDRFVGIPVCNQPEHFNFPRRQRIIRSMLGKVRRHLRHDSLEPRMNETNGLQQFFPQSALEQVGPSPGLERAQHLGVAHVRGEHDDARGREFSANRDHGIDAVHLRHLQVHQGDVGTGQQTRSIPSATMPGAIPGLPSLRVHSITTHSILGLSPSTSLTSGREWTTSHFWPCMP
jgi:hypothetical protein